MVLRTIRRYIYKLYLTEVREEEREQKQPEAKEERERERERGIKKQKRS